MKFLNIPPGAEVPLPGRGSRPNQVHVFDSDAIDAIDAALAAQRPLLIRGEPGIGKSQLARAAAKQLGRYFVSEVVHSKTESTDILWTYDAVARLADAQVAGALGDKAEAQRTKVAAVANYLRPGPLWWAFDWGGATDQAKRVGIEAPKQDEDANFPIKAAAANGVVVLIDEIDKAESEVPNGLLEALGNGEFTPLGYSVPVVAKQGAPAPPGHYHHQQRADPSGCLYSPLPSAALGTARWNSRCLARLPDRAGPAAFPAVDRSVLEDAAKQLDIDRRRAASIVSSRCRAKRNIWIWSAL